MNILDIQKLIQFRLLNEARLELQQHGMTLFVVDDDGRKTAGFSNCDFNRVNVTVSRDRVLNVLSIG